MNIKLGLSGNETTFEYVWIDYEYLLQGTVHTTAKGGKRIQYATQDKHIFRVSMTYVNNEVWNKILAEKNNSKLSDLTLKIYLDNDLNNNSGSGELISKTIYSDEEDAFWMNVDSDYDSCRESDGSSSFLVNNEPIGIVGQDGSEESEFYIARLALIFDTSEIPTDATITKSVLNLFCTGEMYPNNHFDIVVQNGMPDYPHIPVEVNDYNMVHYSGNGGSINTEDCIIEDYNNIELNADGRSWINKGGMTKFMLRSSKDINGEAPTTMDIISVWLSEGDEKPKLYIEYTEGNGEPEASEEFTVRFLPETLKKTPIVGTALGYNVSFSLIEV